ncbi:aspartate aminotransferase family protein [Enterovibrio norvegicus]|uniref:Adenosylmethionine-8-amino-7-oxononanoate aminotransferase n=1 Tax=Enterovibrio norvegicus TaxID=188144 RepID=A0A2N7LER2_9GAMM|nr:aspartate aminotransferase family protein [Enterovibrio norvegicus]PMN93887.1 adenosylmethionine-8-amino-7-oxononanoate aminotransferase [Enterovibrio norvegicus]
MTHILQRHCHSKLPTVTSGEGVFLLDTEGRQYLDGCGGAAVSCLGHSHQGVLSAIQTQLNTIPYAHTGFFTSPAAEELAERLCDRAPGPLNHVYLVSGGSEAVESALKMARQYFLEKGETSRTRFIARRQSYHGNTLGALGVGGNMWRKEPFAPLLQNGELIAPCYAYRDKHADETDFDYGQRVANELEERLLIMGPETVIAFVAEPVVGATAGALVAEKGYFKRIREICDKYGVLLILDEVMCGAGRTGTYFAYEQEEIVPDLVTLAKGLAAGYQPIGAVMVHEKIYNAIAGGTGYFQHGHTFMAHPLACAAACATLNAIDAGPLSEVTEKGQYLVKRLSETFNAHDYVGDIRGRGLFIGIEMVQDKATKTPFASSRPLHTEIKKTAMSQGLMCYPMGGTIDGQQGHHILLAPPFIISENEIDELVRRLSRTMDNVFA